MTTTTTPVATIAPMSRSKPGIARTAVLTTLAAVATNLVVFGLARGAGVEFSKNGSATTVGLVAVLATTAFALALGWILVAFAKRRHRPALQTVEIIGSAFAALSTLAPLTFDVAVSAKLVLTSLHLIPATFYVAGIAYVIRVRTREAQ